MSGKPGKGGTAFHKSEIDKLMIVWRVALNKDSNDWNDEPEYKVLKYYVHLIDAQHNRYWVSLNGLFGKDHEHWIPKEECYFTEARALERLQELKNMQVGPGSE